MLFWRAVSCSTSASMTGHTWSQTWFMSRRAPLAPRPARARRIASRQLAIARSTWGSEVTRPDSSRTTPNCRTCASAMSRWSAGFSLGDREVEQHVLRRLEPRQGELAQPPEVEPAPDHRVDARRTRSSSTDAAVVGRPEGEVGRRPVGTRADGDGDAPDAADDVELLDHRAQRGGLLLDVVGRLGPRQVEVDDALVTRRRGLDLAGHRVDQPAARRQLADLADGRDEVRRPVVEDVVGDGERPLVDGGRPAGGPARTRGSAGG